MYCRDAAIVTDAGVILCNMGKAQRMPEPEAERKAFEQLGVNILGTIESPGTIEGGDVAWLDEKTQNTFCQMAQGDDATNPNCLWHALLRKQSIFQEYWRASANQFRA